MKKIMQRNVDNGNGDCARAAVASLFDKEYDEVPELNPDGSQLWGITKFFKSQGYEITCYNRREGLPSLEEVALFDGGVNGFFYASVPSQTFENVSHAVVVDINLNIVHDPNPNQLAMNLKPEDVVSIICVKLRSVNSKGEFTAR